MLDSIMFPLGQYKKTEVINIAQSNNLPIRNAKESQDCCVFMEDSLADYLKTKLELKEGDIVDAHGKVLGKHRGFQIYTLGQRRGLGGLGEKMYVCGIDPEKNRIVVGSEKMLYKNKISFKIVNPDSFFVEKGQNLDIKLRSTQEQVNCVVDEIDNFKQICTVKFSEVQRSPTPGQSAVLYDGDKVLGGGEILL